jgi:hypothetical protein
LISDDLSNGPGQFNQTFGTITTLAASVFSEDVIYAGTDDGNVWVTQSGGSLWTKISDALPQRWVTRVATDPFEAAKAYVTFSGYRNDDYLSHIYKTSDFGETWSDISGDLPEVPINDVIVDPTMEGALYIATDVGVFASWNFGENWNMLGAELPMVPVCDLSFHAPSRVLVAATYGRSMYKLFLDDFVALPDLSSVANSLSIYPNPAHSEVTIDCPFSESGTTHYEVFDLAGRKVMKGDFTDKLLKINLENLNKGMYTVVVSVGQARASGTFIKQ